MRRFQFRLQALLDTARQRERGIQHDLVRAETIKRDAQVELNNLIRMSAEWESRIRKNQRGRLDLNWLREQLGALGTLHEHIARQRQAVRTAEKASEETRERLTEAARWRKSLERLREKIRQEYQSECATRETRTLDDMATTRAGYQGNPHTADITSL